MKRFFVLSLCLVLVVQFFPSLGIGKVNASNEGVWDGAVTLTPGDALTAEEVGGRPDCSFRDVYVKKYAQPLDSIVQVFSFGHYTLENIGRKCVLVNQQGYFTKTTYGATETSAMYELENFGSATQWLDPAPGGDAVLHITKSQANDKVYRLSLERDYSQVSSAVISGVNIKWRYNSIPTIFVDKNNTPVVFAAHAFSANGRYLAVRFNNGVVAMVDLETRQMTAVTYYPSWANNAELAVSSDGKYVGVKNNELVVFDLTGCQNIYPYPTWELSQLANVPGCTKSTNFQPMVTAAVSSNPSAVLLQQLSFSLDSSTLLIGGGLRKPDAPPTQAGFAPYDWVQHALKPDAWQSTAVGYLAMGDSFSSGEGDNQGGTWYEPGTDEQGDSSTFVGRNLCHLSRRSYPYLIAKDLGLLDGTLSEPASPSSDSLFHSVACSGAKMHNITGLIGEKQDDGGAVDFAITDNQYRYDILFDLQGWQPGATRQENFLNPSSLPNQLPRPYISPEAITISIGGNDVGFGEKLSSCLLPGDCEYATSEDARSEVAVEMIAEKRNLVGTYKDLKVAAPETRIYALGYPQFIQASIEACGNNVHLSPDEVAFVSSATQYFNLIIKSAAQEAGVTYVDVEDILVNRNLCSGADQASMAVNGVTLGNDIALSTVDSGLFQHGLCVFRKCIGSETYHPNSQGHELYRARVLSATDNLQTTNPIPTSSGVPMPSSYWGAAAQAYANGVNNHVASDEVIAKTKELVTGAIDYKQPTVGLSGLLPNSDVAFEIRSDPIGLGVYTVDGAGSVHATLTLPDTLDPGLHTIHAYGVNKTGNKVHYYQQVMIASSDDDFDGDGVPNDIDSCSTITNIFVDEDNDGIDDACDSDVIPIVDPPPPPDDSPPYAGCTKHPRPVCEFIRWKHWIDHRRHSGFRFWRDLFDTRKHK
ncbi:hypothetical protein KC959_03200 [Candidatus Saccharibacteria bacterium]|nr:hypothetical protein [Candidatus Saccharibacteria bacterium]